MFMHGLCILCGCFYNKWSQVRRVNSRIIDSNITDGATSQMPCPQVLIFFIVIKIVTKINMTKLV